MTTPHEPVSEPSWPDQPGPYLFLLDVSTKFEYQMLKDWIENNRPAGVDDVIAARIPASRRLNQHRLDPRLGARMAEGDNPLLVPLRIVWLAKEQDGMRRVRLGDVLGWGDPRDPGRWTQHVIARTSPDRVRIVMGTPARKADIDNRWRDPGGHGPADDTPLEEYVALQAWLSLERAERRLRGSRYKIPKFLREDLFWRRGFQRGVAALAIDSGKPLKRMQAKTSRYLREMAATHSPYMIDVATAITGTIIRTAHRELDYDPAELKEVYGLAQQDPLVFLPSHKSNFDHLVLSYVIYENGLPQNHTAGGINMDFFPIGPLLRRTGIFFIRREFKDNEPYKFVLRKYFEYLLEKRFTLEWYLEGGRSRTGKLREPRLGLLAYVVRPFVEGIIDDVVLVPVSITYDQIADVRSYAQEQAGGAKERESFIWALKFVSKARKRHGGIYLRFGSPIRVADRIPVGTDLTSGTGRLAIPRLAFEVSTGINAVTPITPISLVSLTLLADRRPRPATDIADALVSYREYINARDLPTSVDLDTDPIETFAEALADLDGNGVVTTISHDAAAEYIVEDDEALAVAYYRNVVVHHFLDRAIAEVCDWAERVDRTSAADCALAMRDLLKFDFFFAQRQDYMEAIDLEIKELSTWTGGPFAPAVLRPFVDSHLVVADELIAAGSGLVTESDLIDRCMERGRAYSAAGVVAIESVSATLYTAAAKAATHRGLLEGGAAERESFVSNVTFAADIIRSLETAGQVTK